jgi:signal transduction histidine kinase
MVARAPTIAIAPNRVRHEARTQLTVVRGYAQLAQRQLITGSPEELLAVRRALVAIEQASRALEAWLAVGVRERR